MLYRAHIFSVSSLSISLSLVRRNFQRLTYSVWILNILTWAIIPRNYSSQGFFLYIPPFSNSLCHRSLHMIGSIHFDNEGDQWSSTRYSIRSEILKKWISNFLTHERSNQPLFYLLWKFHHNFYLKPQSYIGWIENIWILISFTCVAFLCYVLLLRMESISSVHASLS